MKAILLSLLFWKQSTAFYRNSRVKSREIQALTTLAWMTIYGHC